MLPGTFCANEILKIMVDYEPKDFRLAMNLIYIKVFKLAALIPFVVIATLK